MNICDNQISLLSIFFNKFDQDNDGCLSESGLRFLLSELEIDENFAPLMLRLFSCSNHLNKSQINDSQREVITFDNFLSFFTIMLSGDMKQFLNLIFSAIDNDKNGKIGVEELIEFSTLIGDSLTEQEAKKILRECSKKNKLNKVMNNKINNNHFQNVEIVQEQELTQDDTHRSCSSSTLREDANDKLKRSKSNRNFQNETKNFVLNDIDFEQLWKCYS